MNSSSSFIVSTEGNNALDLRRLCEKYVNELWLPAHLTPDQAAEVAIDAFRRAVHGELQLLEVKVGMSFV